MATKAYTFVNGAKLEYGTVAVDPASLTTGSEGNTDVTITGAKTGDLVFMSPPATLDSGLVFKGASVQSADTVRVVLRNASGSTVDGASLTWSYLIVHLS